jgi:hypothetical protein
MSHHSSDHPLVGFQRLPTDERTNLIERLKTEQLTKALGPTGEFPHGKLVPHDEGGLIFGVTVFNGRVVFDFGKPIRSLAFTKEGALELAELIKQRAASLPNLLVVRK